MKLLKLMQFSLFILIGGGCRQLFSRVGLIEFFGLVLPISSLRVITVKEYLGVF